MCSRLPMRRLTWLALLGMILTLGPLLVRSTPVKATISMTVDSTTSVESGTPLDEPDAVPGDGACAATPSGKCTLRAAVMEADALAGIDAIFIPAGTYVLTRATPAMALDSPSDGDLDITAGYTLISGIDTAQTILDTGGIDRGFDIGPAGTAYIAALTIRNGSAKTSGIAGVGVGHAHGGGIHNHGGLTLVAVSIVDSTSAPGWGGGGITHAGNGVNPPTNTAELVNVTLDGNRALGSGGGIENLNSSATSLRLNNVTITNNTADSDNDGAGDGGGIFVAAGTVTLANTIVALNADRGGQAPDCAGSLASSGYNLLQSAAGCTLPGAPGDQIGADPLLGPLQDNGGPTLTRAPLAGSPVLDAGNPAAVQPGSFGPACDSRDQRGATRPQDGDGNGTVRCDIGAVEIATPAMHVAGLVFKPIRYQDCDGAGLPCLYARVKVENAAGRNVAGARVTVELARPNGATLVRAAVTNQFGVAELYFRIAGPGTYTLTVLAINKPGVPYDASANERSQRSYTVR